MVKRKRGTFLAENIIFIVLNLAFLIILMLFLFKQGSGAILLEQSYAKQIALLIDSAPAGTEIQINMQEGFELADKNKVNRADVVNIYGNIVKVKLSEKGGYEYSFFNDVDVSEFPGNIYDDSIKNLHFIIVNPKQEFLPENLNEVENEE